MRCLDGATLAAWIDDELSVDAARAVHAHVDGCDRCEALVRGHRQVKRFTAVLSAGPEPAPREDLLCTLLSLPALEHSRDRAARTAAGTTGTSRLTGAALAAGVGAGLVAVAWFAPVSTPAPTAPGASVQPVPTAGPPAGTTGVPTAPVSFVRSEGLRD